MYIDSNYYFCFIPKLIIILFVNNYYNYYYYYINYLTFYQWKQSLYIYFTNTIISN